MTAASTAEQGAERRVLADTNILVYSFTPDEVWKQRIAVKLIDDLLRQRVLVLSAQVLNESYAAITRTTRSHPLAHDQAVAAIRRFTTAAEVVSVSQGITFRALDAIPRHGLSFWDALIWAAAKEAGTTTIYTEDFQYGRDVDGVLFVDPFRSP